MLRQGWHAQPNRMHEPRSAKPTKSKAFRGPNDLPWMARLGFGETQNVAPGMACAAQQNARTPVGEADEKQSFSRAERLAMGEGKRLRSAASCAVRTPPSCAWRLDRRGWGLEKPKMLRQGWHAQPNRMHEARSAKPTKSKAFRGPNDLPRVRTSVFEAPASSEIRTTPSYAWVRLGRRSRRKAQLFESRTTRHGCLGWRLGGKAGVWRNLDFHARDGMHKTDEKPL